MNLSALFYLGAVIAFLLAAFGVAVSDDFVIAWIGAALVAAGLLVGAAGADRRLG